MPSTKIHKLSWRRWGSKTSHRENVLPAQPESPPSYNTLSPIPNRIRTGNPITSAQDDLEISLIITDVCYNTAAGARIRTDVQLYDNTYQITVDIADKTSIALATAVKPNSKSRDAAARASGSIARAISMHAYHGAITAAEVARKTVRSIDTQVTATIRRRGYKSMDSWKGIIRAALGTVRSISEATNPGVAAAGVAGAFQGLV